jgi:trans-aconitate methyltransferase
VSAVADRIAARFESRFVQGYVRSKLKTDPVYGAVLALLRDHPHPIVDVGCGVGLLPLLLTAAGFANGIVGIDSDARKIEAATKASPATSFRVADARGELPPNHSVVLLDVLHYFTADDQRQILANAAQAVPVGGVVIIRDAIDDGSWRYRATWIAETFARLIFWLRAERLNFPTRDLLTSSLRGFEVEIKPLWGRTPFNNYLIVARRR